MRFLITRPKSQGANLAKIIQDAGHQALLLPVIAIKKVVDSQPAIDLIKKLQSFDMAIFISANAVHESAKLIKQYAALIHLNSYLKIAAIGPSTARALAEHGWQADIMPKTQFDSEGLLKVNELLEVLEKKVIIFRGVGGRTLLADTLAKRGAVISQAVTYERTLPKINSGKIAEIFTRKIDAILVMSNESLNNLCTLVGEKYREKLLNVQLVVISKRCKELAAALGFKNPAIIAKAPDEASIFDALMHTRS